MESWGDICSWKYHCFRRPVTDEGKEKNKETIRSTGFQGVGRWIIFSVGNMFPISSMWSVINCWWYLQPIVDRRILIWVW